jgi:prepilin-type processing-associated H-X9-DG protein
VYDAKNAEVRKVRLHFARCPSAPDAFSSDLQWGVSSYAGCHNDVEKPINTDNNGVFILNRSLGYDDITDGASHTIFIGEKLIDPARDLGWMSGTRATLRNTGTTINSGMTKPSPLGAAEPPADQGNLAVGGFASHHPGGANFTFGDGHVAFLSTNLELSVLQQLANRADGKLLVQQDF